MDYAGRLEQLQELIMQEELDGLVYGTGANFQYFTGVRIPWVREEEPEKPQCMLLAAADRDPLAVVTAEIDPAEESRAAVELRRVETLDQVVTELRGFFDGQCIGVSSTAYDHLEGLVQRALPGAKVCDAEGLGEALRVCKNPAELAVLKEAAALTDRVMERIVPLIRPGVTQGELRKAIAEAGSELGAEGTSFDPAALFVKSGTEPTDEPFVYPEEEGLVPGTSVAFDFGFLLDGYCSDFGRSFYCGEAPEHISGAYRALQESQCHLIDSMQPGEVKIGDLFGIIEEALDERGYGDRLRARLPDGTLGHQIGVDLHENPWIEPDCDVVLQPGMVMCLEPKLWLPGEYYLRVEDMVLVTPTGAESLTTFDRELFELPG